MAKKQKHQTKPVLQDEEKPTNPDLYFETLSLDLIDDPEAPMRSDLTPASVEDLVMSIKQVGIIEPIVVKPVSGRFEVIAGHRRLYASRIAKIPVVPCYVRKANNEETEMLKIHENLYREDIKPQDEAKHFDYLVRKQKMTPVKIAQLISKSHAYVGDRLAILDYPDFLREALDNGEINFSVAREFNRFSDEKQMRSAVYYAKRGGMTMELARKWVQDYNRSQEQKTIHEVPPVNGQTAHEPVEHTASCIYCQQGGSLMEMDVVYIHPKCHQHVSNPNPPTENQLQD